MIVPVIVGKNDGLMLTQMIMIHVKDKELVYIEIL